MIYCIKQAGLPICKIGYSIDPNKRLKQLQTGSASRLKILYVIEGDQVFEREIHEKFKQYRLLGGEWFQYNALIAGFFRNRSKKVSKSDSAFRRNKQAVAPKAQTVAILPSTSGTLVTKRNGNKPKPLQTAPKPAKSSSTKTRTPKGKTFGAGFR